MAITLARAGANSADFMVDGTNVPVERVLSDTEWQQLPVGKLKDLLSRRYVTEGDEPDAAAFMLAAAKASFESSSLLYYQGAKPAIFRLTEGPLDAVFPDKPVGIPVVQAWPEAEGTVVQYVQLSVSYSASE